MGCGNAITQDSGKGFKGFLKVFTTSLGHSDSEEQTMGKIRMQTLVTATKYQNKSKLNVLLLLTNPASVSFPGRHWSHPLNV